MRRTAVTALVLVMTALWPAPVLGAAPASEQLAATLLTADDLPPGMTPGGIGDASTFDIDAANYESNGGAGVVAQMWEATAEDPVYRVFDFRFLMPTPEAAEAYLVAAEPVLAEVAAGLVPVTDARENW